MSASLARRGLDKLLAEFPERDVLMVVDQTADRAGPWVCVDLGTPTGELGEFKVEKFAIWARTGAVYRLEPDFPWAVEDDPFLTVTDSP